MDYIGSNIKYLCDKFNMSQDDFGAEFGLKKSVVGTYIRGISHPKIEILQNICDKYSLTLDEFINEDLTTKQTTHISASGTNGTVDEADLYKAENRALQKTIEAQWQTIEAMKITIDTLLNKQ